VAVSARRWSRAAGTAALLVGGLAAALLLGELGVRLAWDVAAPANERPPPPTSPAEAEAAARVRGQPLPVLESVRDLRQPGVHGVHKGLPFRTNRAGFRGADTPRVPPPGVFRVALGGDSISMGSGVLEQDTYAARVEAALNRPARGVRYEVLNLGLSGLNATQVVRRLEKLAESHGAQLLVYGYTLNDIEGPDYVSSSDGTSGPERLARYYRFHGSPSYLLRAVWPRLLALWEMAWRPPGTLEHDYRYNYFENEAAWQAVEGAFDSLQAFAAERGVCVLLLVHTGVAQLNRLYPFLDVMEKVEEAGRARGFTVVQSFPYFEGRDASALRLSEIDPHPNAAGHAVLASALLDGLRALPERCWKTAPGGVPAALREEPGERGPGG
jgi:lysophospholipase L1-like esterase